jgi:hypothetical protein
MLELKGAAKLKKLILHPFEDKAVTIVTLDETKLSLGMEMDRHGSKRLVIFTNTKQGLSAVDTIYFNTYPHTGQRKGKGKHNRAFSGFDERRGFSERKRFAIDQDESREAMKDKLALLGFDPGVVDKIWPQ